MMSDQPPSIETILCAAVEISSADQRAVYLDEACGGDAEIRAQVEKLLRAHLRAGGFLEQPVGGDCPLDALGAATDAGELPGAIDRAPEEISLDFLEPCDVSDRLGKLGTYEVIGAIGRGGMGVVLRAFDPKLNRIVAIKVLAPEFAANPTARRRFLREARAAAAVSHPHVVTIHAVDEAKNTPFLVMECIDGQSLQEKIQREGALQLREILRIGSQIAAGLAAAHGHGLVHRDIKPGNILLENGVERVKITDFGLARAVDDIGVTRTGDVTGTPEFMSPEQAEGRAVEHRSDLFSLGSVLYAMCAGRSPFRADTTVAVLRRVCEDVPRPVREINPEIPQGLVAIIDRLLAKDPDDRFQTAEEVADLLAQHLACLQHPTGTPPLGPKVVKADLSLKARRSQPRHALLRRRIWLVIGLVLLAVFAGLAITEGTGATRIAATVIGIVTGEGTPAVAVDDPSVGATGEDQKVAAWKVLLPAGAPAPAVAPFYAATAKRHQQTWADFLGVDVESENSIGMKLVLIPPGEFDMGSTDDEIARLVAEAIPENGSRYIERVPTEAPRHRVRITKPFWLSRHELTRGQFRQFVEDSGYQTETERDGTGGWGYVDDQWVQDSRFVWNADVIPVVSRMGPDVEQTDEHPVVNVSWNDAAAFCKWLSQKEGVKCHLPSEAQWEYACRAGTTTSWYCGESETELEEHAWFSANARGSTHPAGQLLPNPWGLHDMHGNVWEWCQDWLAEDYYGASPPDDPLGPSEGSFRVYRGGSWRLIGESACRAAFRWWSWPDYRDINRGFRVAAVLGDEPGK
jgi:formylglycine-generating enzyme required for sulfatase activity